MNFDFRAEQQLEGTKLLRRNSPDSVDLDLVDEMMRAGKHRLTSHVGESAETSDGSLPPPLTSNEERDNAALPRGLAYEVTKMRPASVRRDSIRIEHKKRQSPSRLRDDMPGRKSSTSSLPLPPAQVARRRSSLKTTKSEDSVVTSSTRSLSTSSSTKAKRVCFNAEVRVKTIEFPDEEQLARSWLSKEERAEIQKQAKADLRLIKRISKEPDQSSPDIRAIRKSISLRGLEHFFSKRILNDIKEEQQDVICGILVAQELQRRQRREVDQHHTLGGPRQLAKLSAELSQSARDRALRKGQKDEAAVGSYLGRTAREAAEAGFVVHAHSSSSRGGGGRATRRGSMSTSTGEMVHANTSYRSGLSSLGDSIRSAPGTFLDDRARSRKTGRAERRPSMPANLNPWTTGTAA